jgi:mono/diheme cytochrome c family protein
VQAGGTALGGSKRSDGVWLFALDGTISSLPRGSADPGPPPRPPAAAAAPHTAGPEDIAKGKEIYTTACVVCHGESGQGGSHGGAKLTHALTREGITTVVANGRHDMPAFGSSLKPGQLEQVADYVLQLAAQH